MRKLTETEKLELLSDAIIPDKPITRETTLDELDFDSIDAASVAVMAAENTGRGAVAVDDRDIQKCKTVGELLRIIWPMG